VFSGDANNPGPVNSGCAAEPVVITASPTIDTVANPTSGNAPLTLNDSATLHNTSNLLGTGTVTFYLFAPGTTCNTAGTGNVYTQTFSNIANNGPYTTSPGYLASTPGTYQWLAVFSGDTNNPGPVNSGCGTEPVVVNAGFQGCTPGFWKNHPSAWDASTDPTIANKVFPALVSPFGYDPTLLGPPTQANKGNSFNNQPFFGFGTKNPPFPNPGIFGLPSGPFQNLKSNLTLIGALNGGGGGFAALARHGTAALLSAGSVKYTYSVSDVLNGVRNAFLAGDPNLKWGPFTNGVLNDLTAANQQSEQACPTS
jgi:hypothetical protein